MSIDALPDREIPAKHTGLRHVFAATRYSIDGLRCLLDEPAFRHELAFAALIYAILAYGGAPLSAYLTQGISLLALVSVEALNTAIEHLVDRLSPEWSLFAKRAKDLGSLAVGCLILANVLLVILALTR